MRTVRGRLDEQRGFTLVELLVVVLIIGVLMTIALGSFLGARERAADAAAKSVLRTGHAAGKIIFTDDNDYTLATVAQLGAVEASIAWLDEVTASAGPTQVSSHAVDADTLVLAAYSTSGSCFFIRDQAPSQTSYAKLTGIPSTDCYASNTGAVVFGSSW